ncbi:MAG: hypothetical protein GXP31_08755 [Kiritimatiellaeota bacterium]|nr:hypothetical protein [Kiritimatiellota bacterium]
MFLAHPDLTLSALTAVLAATPGSAAPPGHPKFDVIIRAPDFTRGSVKAVPRGGWADGAPIIQCADRSPDWAEWPFRVEQRGVYRVFAEFAADTSRPVTLSIDDVPVSARALVQTTGSWKSSSARWFPAGVAVLAPGRHVLRIRRPTCIPHIVAFGLSRDPTIDPAKGPLALPPELWIQDAYPIQDWMIWTIGGIERFTVRDRTYRIHNGEHVLNRPMYGTNGPETVFAGDRPILLFCRGPKTKLGLLRFELVKNEKRKWLDAADEIDFTWNGAWGEWQVRDALTDGQTLRLATVPLPDAPGALFRIEAPPGLSFDAWFGGVRGDYPDNRAGFGAMPLGDPDADAAGNAVVPEGPAVTVRNPGIRNGECVALVAAGSAAEAWRAVDAAKGKGQAARVRFAGAGKAPVFIAVAANSAALAAVRSDPTEAWVRACRHYAKIADRLRTDTPSAILDAAVRSNNTAMDGQYRPPSFLHGALRWGTECGGWYLGWRGWYGPIVAGDWERVRGAAEMHFEHQFTAPESGRLSRGKIANFVSFDGSGCDTRTGYNMQEVFLDQLRMYLAWTGDFEFLLKQWPRIKAALEYERREMGRDLDGLYTNAVNTWISDGHHYNGCACTQASAYAVARNRFAAEVARRAGEDPAFYEAQAAQTLLEMNHRLWMPDKGYFAEYLDRDGVLHDAAEAPTVYHPIEMGAADPFQAYQMTRYLDERLWRFGDQILANDWFPVIVTNGLLGFNETLNSALAYYYAGRFERGWRLLKTCSESTARAAVPGSISCYASREGEQGSYIDFTDASSLLARTVVEGLFGLRPQSDVGRMDWLPGFPGAWDRAVLRTRGVSVRFQREAGRSEYVLETERPLVHRLRLPLDCANLHGLEVNGKPERPRIRPGVGRPWLIVETGPVRRTVVRFTARGSLPALRVPPAAARGDSVRIEAPDGLTLLELRDPQGMFLQTAVGPHAIEAAVARDGGPHTAFARVRGGPGEWWAPVDIRCTPPVEIRELRIAAVPGVSGAGLHLRVTNRLSRSLKGQARVVAAGQQWTTDLSLAAGGEAVLDLPFAKSAQLLPGRTPVEVALCGATARETARLWRLFDAFPKRRAAFAKECRMLDFPRNYALGRVFTRKYPPGQGPELNNWTWYKTDCINTDALRRHAENGILTTRVGVPFGVRTSGRDGMFLSRWAPFPEKTTVAVGARVDRLYLLLANHTHNSQTHMIQAAVTLLYSDGCRRVVPLRSPHDIDGMLQHYSDMAPEWIGGKDRGWYGHGRATGVHADVTDIPVDSTRELRAFELRCIARETLVGLLGATAHIRGAADPRESTRGKNADGTGRSRTP